MGAGRVLLVVVAALYVGGVAFHGLAPASVQRLVPQPFLSFLQISCLFPNRSPMAIEYRLEVWHCGNAAFEELDTRPHFPIHQDDKENRLHRLGFFHRQNRPVMEALEQYILREEAIRNPLVKVGGVRLSSLRIPHPEPGQPVERYRPRTLAEHPPDLVKRWFYTPLSRRKQNCAADGGVP